LGDGVLNSPYIFASWLSKTLRANFSFKQHAPIGNLGLVIIHFSNCGGVILRKQGNLIYPFIIAIAIFLFCPFFITKIYKSENLKHALKTFTMNDPIHAKVSTIDLEPVAIGESLHFKMIYL
jgi:hypothetical protein